MNALRHQASSGFALLIFVVLLLGAGGVALGGMTKALLKEVNESRYAHNTRVLQEAKQALLMYTYLYPQHSSGSEGPGRLPCPDTDNDGLPNLNGACTGTPGRFPWKDSRMNFYEARDSGNETLWYAVSSNFHNSGGGTGLINSETAGTITIYDRNGSLLYDGSSNGVAAVIISPGEALEGQKRTIANVNLPAHYLERLGEEDDDGNFTGYSNWSFVDSSSADTSHGLRMGPVRDDSNTLVVMNDQMIVVTADEVLAMAERGVLEAYRLAIQDYLSKVDGGGNNLSFPWLFGYDTDDLERFQDGDARGSVGRIPSIFSDYFADADSQGIDSEVTVTLSRSFWINIQTPFVEQTLTVPLSTPVLNNLRFDKNHAGSVADGQVQLKGNGLNFSSAIALIHLYEQSPGLWRICGNADGLGESGEFLSDCNRDGDGDLTSDADNEVDSNILRIGYRINLTSASDLLIDLDVSNLDETTEIFYTDAEDAADPADRKDATITARFEAGEISLSAPNSIEFFYEFGTYDTSEEFTSTLIEAQPFTDNTGFGPIVLQNINPTEIGMRYYPELPAWAAFDRNNWNRAVLMAVSGSYQAGGARDCTMALDCLTVEDKVLTGDAITALLVIAGTNSIVDEDADGFLDDLSELFDPKQTDGNRIFSASNFDDSDDQGDDRILLVGTQ